MTSQAELYPTTDALTPRTYDPAFADDEANIVLQSSDGICYRIPSYTLRTTSGFFRDMMTLSQHNTAAPVKGQDSDVIVLGETSKVFGTLLRMIGGLTVPRWGSIDELEDVLVAAEKYDMPGPVATIRLIITTPAFLSQPLKLYAIAARYGWEDEAKAASKGTLSLSIYDEEHSDVLERIPTSYLLRLFRLHRGRRDEFQRLVSLSNGNLGIPRCNNCGGNHQHGGLKGIASFAKTMVSKIDQQPAGDELLDGTWMTWPEVTDKACCRMHNCAQTILHYHDTIAAWIGNHMKSLPCTV
jgi:hypothetical protein